MGQRRRVFDIKVRVFAPATLKVSNRRERKGSGGLHRGRPGDDRLGFGERQGTGCRWTVLGTRLMSNRAEHLASEPISQLAFDPSIEAPSRVSPVK